MAADNSKRSSGATLPFFALGQAEAAALQTEFLEAYEKANRAWLARLQSEVTLWSDLAKRLSSSSSASEALEASAKRLSQRMQMAAEDGQRLFNVGQEMTKEISRALSSGWPKGST
jgi:hypothetical protein